MTAYTTRMPSGFAGRVTRTDSLTVEPAVIDAATPPTLLGSAVKLVAGKIQPIASGDAASVIYGWLVSSYPTQSTSNGLGTPAAPSSGVADVLRRGYIAIPLARGTAVKGAGVFIRITAASGKLVGDIETTADSGNCVAIPNTTFNGPADAAGIVEIAYKI